MGLAVCGAALGKGSRNVRFPGTTPAAEGTYEPQVIGFGPGIYLKLANASDSSGNGRDGVLGGTGGSFAATALPTGVGSGNTAFDTEGTAFITVANAATDTARTNPTGGQWATLAQAQPTQSTLQRLAGYRFVGTVEISVWFNPQTLPGAGDRAVIVAKGHTAGITTSAAFAESHPIAATAGQTVTGGSLEAYFDANGAVHVEVRSFRGRLCRVRTPDGAVSTGNAYHLSVTLGYSGVTARLNGAQFENGVPNALHVFGLSANIRGVIHNNSYNWMLGKAAWGGQADVILDEFAVFYRAPSAMLSTANHNTLAQQGSTPGALGHYIWDRLTVNVSSYATIQAAINDVSASGGGTVQLNTATYNQNFTLASNVRVKGNGPASSIINGTVRTPTPSIANLGVGSGDLAIGDQTISITNTRTEGDIVVVRGDQGASIGSPAPANTRFDRRWNTEGASQNPQNGDGEAFVVESRTGSAITFQGLGMTFALAAADRQEVLAFTPTSWTALEGLRVVGPTGTSTSTRVVVIDYTRNFRVYNCDFRGDIQSIMRPDTYAMLGSITNITGQKSHVSGVAGGGTAMGAWSGAKDIVYYDVTMTQMERSFYDFSGDFTSVPVIRFEAHNTDDLSSGGAGTFEIKFNPHEVCADCIVWNLRTVTGGLCLQGWKYDYRWLMLGAGQPSGALGRGGIFIDAGGADSYIRDSFHWSPAANTWFESSGESVRRMRLENMERTGTAPANTANANYIDISYCNVDAPGTTGWTESC